MYLCPLCGMQYPGDVPANCQRCKRPLVLNGRWRIEMSIEQGPAGEDFDVVDQKTNDSVILRELRIKKADAAARASDHERYEANKGRLSGQKYEGKKVLLDAFEIETKNSRCYYFVFDQDAWGALGDELYIGSDDGGGASAAAEPLDDLPGRGLDPELEAMLGKLNAERGGPPEIKDSDLGELAGLDTGGGGGGGGGGDSLPAKTSSSGSGIATRTKVVIGVSALGIIGAIIALLFIL